MSGVRSSTATTFVAMASLPTTTFWDGVAAVAPRNASTGAWLANDATGL
ncbi:hypothetical protein C6341_g27016 [Phytophthora cactorum]|nr:hypothetical protein C6341_g27016 [Phytophthora cactorum]